MLLFVRRHERDMEVIKIRSKTLRSDLEKSAGIYQHVARGNYSGRESERRDGEP